MNKQEAIDVLIALGTFASAAGGRRSEQKGVAGVAEHEGASATDVRCGNGNGMCCTVAGLPCDECPRYVPDAEEGEDVLMSENNCVAWSDEEIVKAVHTLREGGYGDERSGAR